MGHSSPLARCLVTIRTRFSSLSSLSSAASSSRGSVRRSASQRGSASIPPCSSSAADSNSIRCMTFVRRRSPPGVGSRRSTIRSSVMSLRHMAPNPCCHHRRRYWSRRSTMSLKVSASAFNSASSRLPLPIRTVARAARIRPVSAGSATARSIRSISSASRVAKTLRSVISTLPMPRRASAALTILPCSRVRTSTAMSRAWSGSSPMVIRPLPPAAKSRAISPVVAARAKSWASATFRGSSFFPGGSSQTDRDSRGSGSPRSTRRGLLPLMTG